MFRYILVEATGRETDMPVFQTALAWHAATRRTSRFCMCSRTFRS
jgi:hypothetical protein